MWVWLLGFSLLCWFVALLIQQLGNWLLEKDLYPRPGLTSMAEVKRLVKDGCRTKAILLYREKFPQIDLREAVYAVDSMK